MTSSIDVVLFSVFTFSFIIHLYYYLFVFRRLAFYEENKRHSSCPPTSVIICARSESKYLREHLPSILTQDYPEYEVVVVDDCSYDDTGEVLKEFTKKYTHLKVVTIKEDEHYSHGKKLAQLVGIKGAKHEHLLFTDADCKPVNSNWIKNMMSNYSNENTEIVLGYGAYEEKNAWLNKLIRFDAFYVAMQYLSFSLINKPYMGVGRNLSYKKSLFYKHKGFASHYHLESGDDDLFVNEAATKMNCSVEIDTSSHTISKAKNTYGEWIRQKRRHITTGKHYKQGTKMMLGSLTGNNYLFLLIFISLLCIKTSFLIPVISVVIVKYIVQMIIFSKAMKKLGCNNLLFASPLLELQMLFFYPIFLLANTFSRKKNKWKN